MKKLVGALVVAILIVGTIAVSASATGGTYWKDYEYLRHWSDGGVSIAMLSIKYDADGNRLAWVLVVYALGKDRDYKTARIIYREGGTFD